MTEAPRITKHSVVVPVSRGLMLDMGLIEPTPEERKQRDAETRKFRREQVKRRAKFREAIAALEALGGLSGEILKLHAPDLSASWRVQCPGCDFSGGEGEPPEWPCRTVRLLAGHFGIDLPEWDMPGAEYKATR